MELVLVLDTTQSMEGQKLADLKQAAGNLIDELAPHEANVKLGIVPFSNYVNVGLQNRNASWISVEDDGLRSETKPSRIEVSPGYCRGNPNATRIDYHDGVPYTRTNHCDDYVEPVYVDGPLETSTEMVEWHGCVRPRNNGRDPLHLSDSDFDTDKVIGFMDKRCADPLLPLTNNLTTAKATLNALTVSQDTFMPAGITWGRRVLSPHEPFTGSAIDGETKQFMVIMTDGLNSLFRWRRTHSRDRGDAENRRQANQDTIDACALAKEDGIEIFTIAFEVFDTATKNILQDCATTPSQFYDARSASQLNGAFKDIANSVTSFGEVRLVQ